jgi:hypothetical protein
MKWAGAPAWKGGLMGRAMAPKVRGALTRMLVFVALMGITVTGATVPAGADPDPGLPTNPSDPRCAGMPGFAQCQRGPYAAPTGPLDSSCISMPADPVCAGGPGDVTETIMKRCTAGGLTAVLIAAGLVS